jgi:hypothetical protein
MMWRWRAIFRFLDFKEAERESIDERAIKNIFIRVMGLVLCRLWARPLSPKI